MKIYPYLRNYCFLLLASQVVNSLFVFVMGHASSVTINNALGEPTSLTIFDFQFVIIWIINFFVMMFIKTDFDRQKIDAPWVLVLTVLNSMAGIAISWLILYLSNYETKTNEHREVL